MRTLNADERALLASRHFNIHARLWVRDPEGKWVNVSALGGENYLKSAAWEHNLDQPVSSGTFVLRRESNGQSIAPFLRGLARLDGTFTPFLTPGAHIRLETAVTPPNASFASWRSVFAGKIDEVDAARADSDITLSCRDMGALLLDAQIERQTTYGSESGVPVLTVMTQMMEDVLGFGAPTIQVVGAGPSLNVTSYRQDEKSLLEAMRDLALQAGGYDLRQGFDAQGKSLLTLSEIQRSTPPVAAIFGPSEWVELDELRLSDATVANAVRVRYQAANGRKLEVAVQDNASIRQYGRRPRTLEAPAMATQLEAEAAALAMLADLAQLPTFQSIQLPYFWPIQLGDYCRFEPDGVNYTSAIHGGVVSIRHSISNGSGRTTIRTRTKPSAATYEWLRRIKSLSLAL